MAKKREVKICECGCGRSFVPKSAKGRFFSDACRKRQNRIERGETPPNVTMCAFNAVYRLPQSLLAVFWGHCEVDDPDGVAF